MYVTWYRYATSDDLLADIPQARLALLASHEGGKSGAQRRPLRLPVTAVLQTETEEPPRYNESNALCFSVQMWYLYNTIKTWYYIINKKYYKTAGQEQTIHWLALAKGN